MRDDFKRLLRGLMAMAVFAVCMCVCGTAYAQDDGVWMFRFYNPNSGEHFYTSSSTEGVNLVDAG